MVPLLVQRGRRRLKLVVPQNKLGGVMTKKLIIGIFGIVSFWGLFVTYFFWWIFGRWKWKRSKHLNQKIRACISLARNAIGPNLVGMSFVLIAAGPNVRPAGKPAQKWAGKRVTRAWERGGGNDDFRGVFVSLWSFDLPGSLCRVRRIARDRGLCLV